ncbi:MAG: DUF3800 domain-containing protein, partial [Planctomycetota bacterium]
EGIYFCEVESVIRRQRHLNTYHFADESGDPGNVNMIGSSRFFIFTMVELDNSNPLHQMEQFKRSLYLPNSFEIKFHKSKAKQKVMFFDLIRHVNFRIRSIVVDKTKLQAHSKLRSAQGQDFMIDCLASLCVRHEIAPIENDFLIVDAAKHEFLKALRIRISTLCVTGNKTKPFKKITGMDSHRCDGLQLADMIAGAIRRYVEYNEVEYYKKIESKIDDLYFRTE